jgi:exosome complex component RRP4
MGELLIQKHEIVTPGENIAKGIDYLPGQHTYRDGDFIVASRLGLVNIDGRAIKLIQLTGAYIPKEDDRIICRVKDITMNGWTMNINSAYHAMLMLKEATSTFIRKGEDLTKFFDIGDYIIARITNVTSQKLVDLTVKGPGLMKLRGGRVIRVNTHKVPRIIGKQASMVTMIKDATNCRITVGQNGIIWIQGRPQEEIIAVDVIKKIERESHVPGLTDKIKEYLVKVTKKLGPKSEIKTENEGEE